MKLTTITTAAVASLLPLLLAVCARADIYSLMACLDASLPEPCDFDPDTKPSEIVHCRIVQHYYRIQGMPKHGDCVSEVRTGTCYESLSGITNVNYYTVKFVCSGNVTKHLHAELDIEGLVIEDVGMTRCHARLTPHNQSALGVCGRSFE